METKVKRLYSIDLFRIGCALMVFMFHSSIHINVDYGVFNNFIGNGHLFMVAFFMLSGFSCFYSDNERQLFAINKNTADRPFVYINIWQFLKKRFFNLYPCYLALHLIQTYKVLFIGNDCTLFDLKVQFAGMPMELGLFHSALIGSFNFLHNGGTWFISCIFICYIFYPYIAQLVVNNKPKNNLILVTILYFISSYAFLPVNKIPAVDFASIYANPLLRFLEFSIGVIIASFFAKNKEKEISKINWLIIPLAIITLFVFITFGTKYVVKLLKTCPVEAYNFIAIPCFAAILYFSARIESLHEITSFRKTIKILSENTYAFFLSQFFAWEPIRYIMKHKPEFLESYSTLKKMTISIAFACIVTAVFHYAIEKPCKKLNKTDITG